MGGQSRLDDQFARIGEITDPQSGSISTYSVSSPPDPLVDWKGAISQLGDRLEHDYLARVRRVAGGFGIWGSSTMVGYEIPLGGRVGRMAGNHVRYARRSGFLGLFGPRVLVRDLGNIEREFRREIEAWLNEEEHRSRTGS
jgi:hypothetical protein